MAEVLLERVEKRFGETRAVAGVDLTVRDQEFVILVGPSGCGQTTTLRMIAGLEEVTAGDIRIGGKSVVHLPPRERDIAMVFQSYALYPHMDVYRNMAFSLQLRGLPKKEIDRRVHEVAEILGLTPQLRRKPRQLSGGQPVRGRLHRHAADELLRRRAARRGRAALRGHPAQASAAASLRGGQADRLRDPAGAHRGGERQGADGGGPVGDRGGRAARAR